MGHKKRVSPGRGSKMFWPRKRAARQYPCVKNWAKKDEVKPLGFAGYKAGMTHIFIADNTPNSPTKGEEIRVPVTIIECPDLCIAGLRLYETDAYGSHVLTDVLADSFDKSLDKKINLPKKKHDISKVNLDGVSYVRLLVYTQPKTTTIGKKKPEILELPLGGDDAKVQFEFAKNLLGKTVSIDSVFKAGQWLDTHSVSTGRGFQGVIKRFNVKRRHHKSEKGVRRIGTMGGIVPCKTPWWIPQCGQMGYNTRTEYNRHLMKIADSKEENATPRGGLLRYGVVQNKYIFIKGSIAGPKKRLIVLSHAIRNKEKREDAPNVIGVSLRSQQ